MDWEHGSTVLIVGSDELWSILKVFSPTFECITPLTIEQVADQYATLIEIIPAPEDMQVFGDIGILLLESGDEVILPIQSFDPINVKIETLEDSGDKHQMIHPSGSVTSYDTIVAHSLAAECIQVAYRRHKLHKSKPKTHKKQPRYQSIELLAAETIKTNLKRVLSKSKSQIKLEEVSTHSSQHAIDSIPTYAHNTSGALQITTLKLKNIPKIAWNDENNLYILFCTFDKARKQTEQSVEHATCYYTDTVHAAGSHAEWLELDNISLPIPSKSVNIAVEVYHEYLALDDKLIATTEITSDDLQQTAFTLDKTLYEPSIHTSSSSVSLIRRARGDVTIIAYVDKNGTPMSPMPPKLKNKGKITAKEAAKEAAVEEEAASNNSSVQSKFIEIKATPRQQEVVNNMTPRRIITAARNLTTWEQRTTVVKKKESNGGSGNNAMNNSHSRVSNLTEDDQQSTSKKQQQLQPVSIAKENIPIKSIKKAVTKKKAAVAVIFEEKFIFDQAYRMAFLTSAATLTMSIKEVKVLLDALDFAVDFDTMDEYDKEKVIVPIQATAAFADRMTEVISSYPSILLPQQTQQQRDVSSSSASAAAAIGGEIAAAKSLASSAAAATSSATRQQLAKQQQLQQKEQQEQQLLPQPITSTRTIMTADLAETAINHLHRLLRAHYTSLRNIILTASNNGIRPKYLSTDDIRQIIALLQVNLQFNNGEDFLNSNDIASLSSYPAVVGARFAVFQKTCQLLDTMWDRGLRPYDLLHDPTTVKQQAKVVKSSINSSSSALRQQKQQQTAQQVNGQQKLFQISESSQLFQALSPINRAYGLGITLSVLSQLCNVIGDMICTILSPPVAVSVKELASVKWVTIQFPSVDMQENAVNILTQSIAQCAELLQLVHIANSSRDSNIGGNQDPEEEKENHSTVSVRVPVNCLTWHNNMQNSTAKSLFYSQSPLSPHMITLGMHAMVISNEHRLKRLCERFQWYDQPQAKVMSVLCGKVVEVISIAELKDKGRVGVRLVQAGGDRGDTGAEICEALPLEALLPYTPPLAEDDNDLPEAEHSSSKKHKGEITAMKKRRKSMKTTSTRRKSFTAALTAAIADAKIIPSTEQAKNVAPTAENVKLDLNEEEEAMKEIEMMAPHAGDKSFAPQPQEQQVSSSIKKASKMKKQRRPSQSKEVKLLSIPVEEAATVAAGADNDKPSSAAGATAADQQSKEAIVEASPPLFPTTAAVMATVATTTTVAENNPWTLNDTIATTTGSSNSNMSSKLIAKINQAKKQEQGGGKVKKEIVLQLQSPRRDDTTDTPAVSDTTTAAAVAITVNRRPQSAPSARSKASNKEGGKGKDYTWLKSPQRQVQEQLLLNDSLTANDSTSSSPSPPHPANKKQSKVVMHSWQPQFSRAEAEYAPGVMVYRQQDDSLVLGEDKVPRHAIDVHPAAAVVNVVYHRAGGTHAAVVPPDDATKAQHVPVPPPTTSHQLPASGYVKATRPLSAEIYGRRPFGFNGPTPADIMLQANNRPKSPPVGIDDINRPLHKELVVGTDDLLGLSGLAYTAGGGLKAEPVIAFPAMDQALPETKSSRPTSADAKKKKKKKKKKTKQSSSSEKSKASLEILFGINTRPVDDKTAVVSLDIAGKTKTLSTGREGTSSSPARQSYPIPEEPAEEHAEETLLTGRTEVEAVTNAAANALKGSQTLREALYYSRESARTSKEGSKKENYLLKQLKKLGIVDVQSSEPGKGQK